jgi:signal peptidase I
VTPESNEPALVVDEPAGGAAPSDPPPPPADPPSGGPPGDPVAFDDQPPVEPPPRPSRWLREVAIVVVVAVLVAVLLHTFVVQTFYIPSGSVEPTLQIGDRILVDKLSYDLHSVHRGDIVVFGRPPAEDCGGPQVNDLVKRVIGLPGDMMSLSGGYVYVDGKRLDESWLPTSEQGVTTAGPVGHSYDLVRPYRVPANDYFVMGDNRTDSCDSRYWGPIPKSLIVGQVALRVWPLTSFTIF